MRKFNTTIFCFIIIISSFSFAQTIIWEREYELGEPAVLSLIPTIIDSDTNIVILFDQYLTTTCFCPSFFKYDRNGTLLNYNKYETENYMLYPTVLEETNSSYRIFCGWGRPNAKSKASFVPAVLNIDKEGNLMELNIPYDITKSTEKEISSFLIQSFSTLWASLPINNKFYHPFVYNFVKVDENKAETRPHLIITCFDTLGKVVWRKGYDTISNFGDNLFLLDKGLDQQQLSILQMLKADTSGNIIIKLSVLLKLLNKKSITFWGKE